MATAFDLVDRIWPEAFGAVQSEETRALSNFYARLPEDSSGVRREGPPLSRDWKWINPMVVGQGGAAEFSPLASSSVATDTNATGYSGHVFPGTWPGLQEQVLPRYFHKTITLKRLKFSLFMPLELMEAMQNGEIVDDFVERIMRGAARKVAHLRCLALFSSSAIILKFTSAAQDITSTPVDITISAGYPVRRLEIGQACDIFKQSSNVRENVAPVFVDGFDAFGTSASPIDTSGGTVRLGHLGAASTTLAAGNQVYDLVFRNSGRENGDTSRMPLDITSLFKDTGEIADYGVHVSGSPPAGEFGPYPHLKSMLRAIGTAAAPKTPSWALITKYLAHWRNFHGKRYDLDTAWTTSGGYAAYINDRDGQMRYERQGAVAKFRDGAAAGVTGTFDGWNIDIAIDDYMNPGEWLICQMAGNWMVKRPPRLPGTARMRGMDPGLEFATPLLNGGGSVWQGARVVGGPNAGAPTEQLEALASLRYEIAQRELQPGIKLTGGYEFIG